MKYVWHCLMMAYFMTALDASAALADILTTLETDGVVNLADVVTRHNGVRFDVDSAEPPKGDILLKRGMQPEFAFRISADRRYVLGVLTYFRGGNQ